MIIYYNIKYNKMKYYIETSKGRVNFESENIEILKVIHDYWQTCNSEYIYKNCIFDNITLLNDIYNWGIIDIIKNENGLFLTLCDCEIASWYAEYKIYEL